MLSGLIPHCCYPPEAMFVLSWKLQLHFYKYKKSICRKMLAVKIGLALIVSTFYQRLIKKGLHLLFFYTFECCSWGSMHMLSFLTKFIKPKNMVTVKVWFKILKSKYLQNCPFPSLHIETRLKGFSPKREQRFWKLFNNFFKFSKLL